MVVEVTDTDLTIHMLITLLVYHTGVDHKQQDTSKITILIDINLMLHGVLEVMGHSLVTEVLEDVKVLL